MTFFFSFPCIDSSAQTASVGCLKVDTELIRVDDQKDEHESGPVQDRVVLAGAGLQYIYLPIPKEWRIMFSGKMIRTRQREGGKEGEEGQTGRRLGSSRSNNSSDPSGNEVFVTFEFLWEAQSSMYHSGVHIDSWSVGKAMSEMSWNMSYFQVLLAFI